MCALLYALTLTLSCVLNNGGYCGKVTGETVHYELAKIDIDVGQRTVYTWLKKLQEERFLSANAYAKQWAEQYLQGEVTEEMVFEKLKENEIDTNRRAVYRWLDALEKARHQLLPAADVGTSNHPNQHQQADESSFYQLQAPQVAASQSSNSDNPGSPGSPSSNGGDVFRQFSRVFGEESNADDGTLYSIIRPTQSKKG
uniref:Secreted protein n=1 Tax=Globodera rostochiensis TaxID=31243 RepID=A0A914GWA9_GLORO